MSEFIVLLLSGDWKQQKLCDAIREISFDLLQRRSDIVANVPAQSGDRLFLPESFNHEEWLDQLSAIELSLGTQITQVLRTSEAHQSLHYKDISFSHCPESEPRADRRPGSPLGWWKRVLLTHSTSPLTTAHDR